MSRNPSAAGRRAAKVASSQATKDAAQPRSALGAMLVARAMLAVEMRAALVVRAVLAEEMHAARARVT